MYPIDSMFNSIIEAIIPAVEERRIERWIATGAWWLYRQDIYSAKDFWGAVAAKVTKELSDDAIIEQLSKKEEALLDQTLDWPEIPESLRTIVASWSPEGSTADLETLREEAIKQIDRAAENYRLQFITPGYGQVMTYQQKLAEARAKIEDPDISDELIPHVAAEAAVDGVTTVDKATEIVRTFEEWQKISVVIETRRMAAKKAVAEAATAEEIKTATDVAWTSETI